MVEKRKKSRVVDITFWTEDRIVLKSRKNLLIFDWKLQKLRHIKVTVELIISSVLGRVWKISGNSLKKYKDESKSPRQQHYQNQPEYCRKFLSLDKTCCHLVSCKIKQNFVFNYHIKCFKLYFHCFSKLSLFSLFGSLYFKRFTFWLSSVV